MRLGSVNRQAHFSQILSKRAVTVSLTPRNRNAEQLSHSFLSWTPPPISCSVQPRVSHAPHTPHTQLPVVGIYREQEASRAEGAKEAAVPTLTSRPRVPVKKPGVWFQKQTLDWGAWPPRGEGLHMRSVRWPVRRERGRPKADGSCSNVGRQ